MGAHRFVAAEVCNVWIELDLIFKCLLVLQCNETVIPVAPCGCLEIASTVQITNGH